MNTKKLIPLIIIVIAVAALALLLVNKPRARTSVEPIKIGAILPMSGDFADFGEAINKGALIAIEEAKKEGANVEYISEDDHSNPTGSVNAAQKLVQLDKIDGVLTATVQEVKPVASIFESSKVPLVATWDSNDYIKSAGNNIFTIGFSTEDAGYKMAMHAYNTLGLRKVSVVSQKDDWSQLIGEAFAKKFTELGGTIVVNEQLVPSQKDFRSIITKITRSGSEGIYFPFLPGTIAPFIKQGRELGFNGALMTGDSISLSEVNEVGSLAEHVYFTNLYAENIEALSKKYEEKYGETTENMTFVSFGYDGVKTLLAASKISEKENITMSEALRKVSIKGIDRTISFNGKSYAEKTERLYKVEKGEFVEVAK